MTQSGLVHRLLPAAAMLVIGLAAAPASAQVQIESREGIALRDQVDELRHEVQVLQAQVSNGGGGSLLGGTSRPPPSGGGGDVTAQLLVRVDQLDDQVRQLRGRIDELQNQLQQQTADLGKRIDDLSFQMQNPQAAAAAGAAARQAGAAGASASPTPPTGVLGTSTAGPPGAGQPGYGAPRYAPPGTGQSAFAPPGAPPGAAPQVRRTPELAMQEGYAALARRDYVTAEAVAHEVLSNNRVSPRAYDAMFLLAEAQAGQRQYSQAALSFDDTYNRARRGAHAEDALIGLANSLVGLGDKSAACQALVRLHAEFPTPRSDLREPIAMTRQRAGCR